MSFFVRAKGPDAQPTGRLAQLWEDVKGVVGGGWTWDEALAWARSTLHEGKDKARRLFRYLTGESDPPPTPPGMSDISFGGVSGSGGGHSAPTPRTGTQIGRASAHEGGGGIWGSITGIFGGFGRRAGSKSGVGGGVSGIPIEKFEEGEVHAELVKV